MRTLDLRKRERTAARIGYGLLTLALAMTVAIASRQENSPSSAAPAPRQPHQLRPANHARLYTRHVLFDWHPISGAAAYRLQVAEVLRNADDPFAGLLAADLTVDAPQQVVAAGLDFGRRYAWRVQPLKGTATADYVPAGPWSQPYYFSIAPLPKFCPPTAANRHRPKEMQPGLTLFNVSSMNKVLGGQDAGLALVVDDQGQIVWFRYEPKRFTDLHLLPNGNVLYVTGEAAYEATLDGRVVWRTPPRSRVHHHVDLLPNGNLLCLVYDERRVTFRGRRETWRADAVEEITRDGRVVWRWSVFDHLRPDLVDEISYRKWNRGEPFDWTHGNAAHYNDRHKAIYLSLRDLSRVIKIDKRTKRIIWQMGPGGDVGQDFFSWQHAPKLLPNNHLLIYDNGNRRGGKDATQDLKSAYSRVIEVEFTSVKPLAAQIVWEYRLPFNPGQGEADRLANGNTLIADGYNGRVLEVNRDGHLLWELVLPITHPNDYLIYRAERVASLYPQFGDPPVIQ